MHHDQPAPPAATRSLLDSYRAKLFRPAELSLGLSARDRLWGWLGPLIVTIFGGILRFTNLGHPAELVFDETYYVKDAYTLTTLGYEARWPDDIDAAFASGDTDTYLHQAAYVVHPPIGKLLIGWGIRFGGVENPWAWRIVTALLGTVAIFILARTARRILGSTALGTLAGGVMAIDGMGIVLARTALLDGIVMFFIVAAFACLVADRFQARHRLAARMAALDPVEDSSWRLLPGLGFRWWRLAAGVLLGLASATKWSGFYALAVFGVLTVWWDWSARRAVGGEPWLKAWFFKDAVLAFFVIVPTALIVYISSWFSWFTHPDAWGRRWHEDHPSTIFAWLPDGLEKFTDILRSWWHYHATMLDFHASLDDPHRYMANPFFWPLQIRPTSFYWREDEVTCTGTDICVQAVTSLGNPLIWWLGTVVFVIAVWRLIRRHDWRAGSVVAGYCAVWVPWLFLSHRTIFTFYMVALVPFVALACAYGARLALDRCQIDPVDIVAAEVGPEGIRTRSQIAARRRIRVATRRAKLTRRWIVIVFAICVVVSAFYYPIWTAWKVPYTFWLIHMWLPTWI